MGNEEVKGYKRIHFFKYFLNEDDWNARHNYHTDKLRLHNRVFHGYGIRDGRNALWPMQIENGTLSIQVTPGFASDMNGRELLVENTSTVAINTQAFALPCTVYVKLRYAEMAADRIRFADGRIENKYFRETYKIEVSDQPPAKAELEICRIALTSDVQAIRNAAKPDDPQPNEIDTRFRREFSTQDTLSPDETLQLRKIFRARKYSFDRLGGNIKLDSLASIAHTFLILEEMLDAGLIRKINVPVILDELKTLDELFNSKLANCLEPRYLERPEWQRHQALCRTYRKILSDPSKSLQQKMRMLMDALEKVSASYSQIDRLFGNDRRIYKNGRIHPPAASYLLSSDWDVIKTWSAEFPQVFELDDLEWLKCGELVIANEKSEKFYKFRICDARDAWKNRQKLMFPDGTIIEDTGVAHEGGFSEFTIPNVIPDTPLAIIRMMDYARGDYELMINVNGKDAGISRCEGYDRQYRWRNWPFVIPARFVTDTTLHIKQIPVSADRDVNMFCYWFYQPMNI